MTILTILLALAACYLAVGLLLVILLAIPFLFEAIATVWAIIITILTWPRWLRCLRDLPNFLR